MGIRARLIQQVGTRAWLRVYWGNDCPSCGGSGRPGYHNAMRFLADSDKLQDYALGGYPHDYPVERWPMKCDHCPAVVPQNKPWSLRGEGGVFDDKVNFQVFHKVRFDTPSGRPEPGDVFWAEWYDTCRKGLCVYGWTNCDGRHLIAILPNKFEWDIMSRASNCTKKSDTIHRCWVVQGSPPNVTVGKGGVTCEAGAGSIIGGDWHGYLDHGVFDIGRQMG